MAPHERGEQVVRHFARITRERGGLGTSRLKTHLPNRRSDHSRGVTLAPRWFGAAKGERQKLPGRE